MGGKTHSSAQPVTWARKVLPRKYDGYMQAGRSCCCQEGVSRHRVLVVNVTLSSRWHSHHHPPATITSPTAPRTTDRHIRTSSLPPSGGRRACSGTQLAPRSRCKVSISSSAGGIAVSCHPVYIYPGTRRPKLDMYASLVWCWGGEVGSGLAFWGVGGLAGWSLVRMR